MKRPTRKPENGWLETAYLLRSTKNARRLLAASQRAEDGQGEVFVVDQLRRHLGLERSGSDRALR